LAIDFMPDAVLLSACRTPIGKFRGALSSLPAVELGAVAVREAVARAGCEPNAIDEVILGNVLSAGVIASASMAAQLGRRPLARIVASATTGAAPRDLFTTPVAAISRVLTKANRALGDIDLFEINEAFAVQMLACMRELRLSPDRVNVHGGAIALGHPIGASGARVLVTLLNALERRDGRLGIAALCLGGGNAVAMLVERESTR
jgi:acetyl-CoA C-acetyltransferase